MSKLKHDEIKVGGMSCAMCVKTVEDALSSKDGVEKANVNLSTDSADIIYDPDICSIDTIKDTIEKSGYEFIGVSNEEEDINFKEDEKHRKDLKSKLIRIIIGIIIGVPLFVLMYVPVSWSYMPYAMFTASLSFIYIGFPIMKNAVLALKNLKLDMNVMYTLGMLSAFISSVIALFGVLPKEFMFFEVPVMLATFINIGKYLETKAKGKTSESIKKLMGIRPKYATVIREGEEKEVLLKEMHEDDVFIVKAGEKIATDGTIIEGESEIDESMISGEPVPKHKSKGEPVYGATISKSGYIKVKATKVGSDTVLSQIIELVRTAQNSKPELQKISDKVVSRFIPVVFAIAVITFLLWLFVFDADGVFAFSRLISVLVIACPCALGLATPTAVTAGLGRGAELGILFKDTQAFEISQKVDTVIFDKTGTLTQGKPVLTDVKTYGDIDKEYLLKISGSLENQSEHHLGQAIVNECKNKNIKLSDANDFKIVEGGGIQGKVEGKQVILGNRKLIKKHLSISDEIDKDLENIEKEGKTAVISLIDNDIAGIFGIGDTVKDHAKTTIQYLIDKGYEVYMITGDNRRTAKAVANEIGINNIMAEVMPADKSEKVKELQNQGKTVAFAGDGINDAPALAQADLGISLGSGTDVAIESGDIVLMRDDLKDVIKALVLSKRIMKQMRYNLFWAFAYNTLLIPIAAGLFSSFGIVFKPEFAGLAMALSSVTVVTLSLLLKVYKPKV